MVISVGRSIAVWDEEEQTIRYRISDKGVLEQNVEYRQYFIITITLKIVNHYIVHLYSNYTSMKVTF